MAFRNWPRLACLVYFLSTVVKIEKLFQRPKVSGKPKKSTVNKGDQNDEHGPETVFENVESNDKTLDNGQPFIVANDLNTHEHIDNSFEVFRERNRVTIQIS